MKHPNFFLIGASKSGTTSLYHYLKQHPDIFMCPEKEPSYFLFPNGTPPLVLPDGLMSSSFRNNIKNAPRVFPTRDEYLAMFKNVREEKIVGEASPDYLIGSETPGAIFDFAPSAKIMVVLRNPFDAAYSEFLMNQRDGEFNEGTTFLELLSAEDLNDCDLQKLPKLIRTRFYSKHINRYLEVFPKDQMRCFLFEDLDNMDQLLKDTFEFLGVSTQVRIDTSLKYNAAKAQTIDYRTDSIRNLIPNSIKGGLKKALPVSFYSWYWNRRLGVHQSEKLPVKCPEDAKEYLTPIFTPVIQELEELLKRDLSLWLR
ncbi:sulfotransferase domain-containing protein [Roseivirga sp.]|uniref:sulfotransferase domain-containing protein n=1 Tax=Roseivirga sp. TaxID=1964215 RepID=UPI003B51A79C